MRWFRAGLAGLTAILAVLSLVNADGLGLLPQMQAAGPVLALAALALALVLMFSSPRAGLVCVLSGLVLLAPLASDVASSQAREPLPGGQAPPGTVTVLSTNTYFGQEVPARTLAQVRWLNPDVLVLIEESPAHFSALERLGIRDLLPHATGSVGGSGATVVLTKDPMTCMELAADLACNAVRDVSDRSWPAIVDGEQVVATFDMPVIRLAQGTVFKAVHAWSPRLSPQSRWLAEQQALIHWRDQAVDEPRLIMAGDFNASRSHPVFRELLMGMVQAPSGYGPWTRTWPNGWFFPRFVQIDHVLAKGFKVVAAGTFAGANSDHDAVWAQVAPAD